MPDSYTVLSYFPRVRDASEMLAALDEAGVAYEVITERKGFDPSFALIQQFDSVAIQVHQTNETAARKALAEAGLEVPEVVYSPQQSPLAEFSDQELRDVVYYYDQWHADEVENAQQLLQIRGRGISASELAEMRARRNEEIDRPATPQSWQVVFAVATAFLIPPVGFALGCVFLLTKSRDHRDNEVPYYAEKYRVLGAITAFCSLMMLGLGYYLFLR